MTKHVLHVVTNVAHYADSNEPTGLWLSELTHAYHVFKERGYRSRLVWSSNSWKMPTRSETAPKAISRGVVLV